MHYYKGFHDSVKVEVEELEKKVRERRGSTSSIEIVVELMHGFLI